MDINEKIRRRIKELRLKKGLSQGKIAKALNVHPTYISQIERGGRMPTFKTVERIAKALGVSMNEMLK
jgi:transcriptional regulator with XRE-family HTH domain